MNLKTTIPGRVYYFFIKLFYEFFLKNRNLSPMFFTFSGLFFAFLVPFSFLISPLVASIMIFLSGVLDSIDGYIARDKNQNTKFGAFLDSSIDRISDFFYLCGFWIYFYKNGFSNNIWLNLLILTSILFTLLISYTKARIESLGGQCNKGFMTRAIRVIYLILWSVLMGIFYENTKVILWIGLLLYAILTFLTVIQRILHANYELKH